MNWWDAPHIQGFKWSFVTFWQHSGIDLGMPFGTPLTSPVHGTVIGANCFPWGGQVDILTTLEDGNQHVISFLHLSQIAGGLDQHVGQSITAGTVIGYSGGLSTQGGCRTGVKYSHETQHLHFELTVGYTAPYSGAGGGYTPSQPPFTPAGANLGRHPEDPTSLLQAIHDGDGVVQSGGSGGTPSGPTPGQKSHKLLDSVPGFLGICEALDAAEQFEPFTPPSSNNTPVIGGAISAGDTFGYTAMWTARNALVVATRSFIMGIGVILLVALAIGLIAANRWIGEAGGLGVAAAMHAV